MGAYRFQLPPDLSAESLRELIRGYVSGGPDNMPWPTEMRVEGQGLIVERGVSESGFVGVPWHVDGFGRLFLSTATLRERPETYYLMLELVRGKVNQVRSQAADWQAGGLEVSPDLEGQLRAMGQSFARIVCCQENTEEAIRLARVGLAHALGTGEQLVAAYIDQVFQVRQQRIPRLETIQAVCVAGPPPGEDQTRLLQEAFNTIRIPMYWGDIQPTESTFDWEEIDALVRWARGAGFSLAAGPLIDFSPGKLPPWLDSWRRDPRSIITYATEFVEDAIKRYRKEIPIWQLTAASNWMLAGELTESEMLQVTAQVYDYARRVEPNLGFLVGISQPWGEYLARQERNYTPFVFADMLLRSGLTLAGLDLEVVAGFWPRGSCNRDRIEFSRLLDMFALLALPLHVTLGCPSGGLEDPRADARYEIEPFGDGSAWSPEFQADWTTGFARLAASKPYVQGVTWTTGFDAASHAFAHTGLFDLQGKPKPALERLKTIRQKHLR